MKIACERCEEVVNTNSAKYNNWIELNTKGFRYKLCPKCRSRFFGFLNGDKLVGEEQEEES